MTTKTRKGLGNLLTMPPVTPEDVPPVAAPAAPVSETVPQQAAAPAPQPAPAAELPASTEGYQQWTVTEDLGGGKEGEVLGTVHATNERAAAAIVAKDLQIPGGFLLTPVDDDAPAEAATAQVQTPGRPAARTPARPGGKDAPARTKRKRVAKDKLTVAIPITVLDALQALTDRDDTLRYDEVEAALRAHLAKKRVTIENE